MTEQIKTQIDTDKDGAINYQELTKGIEDKAILKELKDELKNPETREGLKNILGDTLKENAIQISNKDNFSKTEIYILQLYGNLFINTNIGIDGVNGKQTKSILDLLKTQPKPAPSFEQSTSQPTPSVEQSTPQPTPSAELSSSQPTTSTEQPTPTQPVETTETQGKKSPKEVITGNRFLNEDLVVIKLIQECDTSLLFKDNYAYSFIKGALDNSFTVEKVAQACIDQNQSLDARKGLANIAFYNNVDISPFFPNGQENLRKEIRDLYGEKIKEAVAKSLSPDNVKIEGSMWDSGVREKNIADMTNSLTKLLEQVASKNLDNGNRLEKLLADLPNIIQNYAYNIYRGNVGGQEMTRRFDDVQAWANRQVGALQIGEFNSAYGDIKEAYFYGERARISPETFAKLEEKYGKGGNSKDNGPLIS